SVLVFVRDFGSQDRFRARFGRGARGRGGSSGTGGSGGSGAGGGSGGGPGRRGRAVAVVLERLVLRIAGPRAEHPHPGSDFVKRGRRVLHDGHLREDDLPILDAEPEYTLTAEKLRYQSGAKLRDERLAVPGKRVSWKHLLHGRFGIGASLFLRLQVSGDQSEEFLAAWGPHIAYLVAVHLVRGRGWGSRLVRLAGRTSLVRLVRRRHVVPGSLSYSFVRHC